MKKRRDIFDLPPTLLSDILWFVYLGVPLKDWLKLKTVCSTWAHEIDTLVTIRDPLDDAKGQVRMRHLQNESLRPIPAFYCARLMPRLQYAKYFQKKIMVFGKNDAFPFARDMFEMAIDFASRQDDLPTSIAKDQHQNDILYQLCVAYATDPTVELVEYPLRLASGQPSHHHLFSTVFVGLADDNSIGTLPEVNDASKPFVEGCLIDCAARGGHPRLVSTMLAKGYKPRIYMGHSRARPSEVSPRAAAAYLGHTEVVKVLSQPEIIASHTEADASKDLHNSILAAAQGGHDELVKSLLSCEGVEKLPATEVANNLIWIASRHGFSSLVRLGIQRGGDVNAKNSRWQSYPLIIACSYGREDVVKLLLSSGASLYHTASRLQAADEAAAHGHVGTMKLLIDAGLVINQVRGNPGWMGHALRYGQVGVMQCLLDAGYQFDNVDAKRLSNVIGIAAWSGYSSAIVLAAHAGADVQEGVRVAREQGQVHVLQALKDAGLDTAT